MSKTLFDLAVGDEVVYVPKHNQPAQILTVERVTPTMIDLGRCRRFYKRNGEEVGGGYSPDRIWIGEEGEILRIKATKQAKELAEKIQKAGLLSLSLDQLTRIMAIIEEGKEA